MINCENGVLIELIKIVGRGGGRVMVFGKVKEKGIIDIVNGYSRV